MGMNTPHPTANNPESAANPSPAPTTAGEPAPVPDGIQHRHVSRAVHVPARWRILRELAKGEPLPVNELSRRVRCPAASVSKHMAILKLAGVVKVGYGRLYKLSPGVQAQPGAQRLDLGHCILKLDSGW